MTPTRPSRAFFSDFSTGRLTGRSLYQVHLEEPRAPDWAPAMERALWASTFTPASARLQAADVQIAAIHCRRSSCSIAVEAISGQLERRALERAFSESMAHPIASAISSPQWFEGDDVARGRRMVTTIAFRQENIEPSAYPAWLAEAQRQHARPRWRVGDQESR